MKRASKPGLTDLADQRLELVYVGARQHGSRILHGYMRGDDQQGRVGLYEQPLSRHPPGSVVAYRSQDGKTAFTGGELYRGRWHDADQAQRWQIEHDAVLMAGQAWADAELPGTLEVLDPVRDVYRTLSEDQRALLLMHVVRYIVED